jgi:fucose permease
MQLKGTHNPRLIFIILYLTYICASMISILVGPTLPLLAANTGVPLDVAGWAFATSAFGFLSGVILAGIISARFGPKTVLLSGLFIMAISSLVTPLTHSYWLLLLAQFVQGMGFGFLDVSINVTVQLVFAETLSETLNNLHSAFGLGALIAPLVLSVTLQLTSEIFLAYLCGTIIGIIALIMLLPQAVPSPSPQHAVPQGNVTVSSSILRQPLLWLMALQIGLYVGAEVGFGNWIVTVVSLSAKITLALAAPCATFLWLGLTLGRLASAQVLRRGLISEYQMLYICVFGSCISDIVVALFPAQLVISFGASGLVGFFFGPLFPGIMAIATRWFAHALGTVSGTLLVSAGLFSMVLPVMMGFLIPVLGLSWVIALPALASLAIALPLSLAYWRQRRTLQLSMDRHTMGQENIHSPIQQKQR